MATVQICDLNMILVIQLTAMEGMHCNFDISNRSLQFIICTVFNINWFDLDRISEEVKGAPPCEMAS